jgi:hypothetical protein
MRAVAAQTKSAGRILRQMQRDSQSYSAVM